MNVEMDQAISDLEQSTEKLLATEFADLAALAHALELRANAITKIAVLAECESAESDRNTAPVPDTVERLAAVLVRGEEATRRMFVVKQQAHEEWTRLDRILRGIEEASARVPGNTFDCAG